MEDGGDRGFREGSRSGSRDNPGPTWPFQLSPMARALPWLACLRIHCGSEHRLWLEDQPGGVPAALAPLDSEKQAQSHAGAPTPKAPGSVLLTPEASRARGGPTQATRVGSSREPEKRELKLSNKSPRGASEVRIFRRKFCSWKKENPKETQ